jgi:hypothetical protein
MEVKARCFKIIHRRHHYWRDSLFWATAFLRRFYQTASSFHLFGFHYNFFTEQGCQPCVQPPNLEHQVPVFMPPSDRVAQLYAQAQGSICVAFYNSQGYCVGDQNYY